MSGRLGEPFSGLIWTWYQLQFGSFKLRPGARFHGEFLERGKA